MGPLLLREPPADVLVASSAVQDLPLVAGEPGRVSGGAEAAVDLPAGRRPPHRYEVEHDAVGIPQAAHGGVRRRAKEPRGGAQDGFGVGCRYWRESTGLSERMPTGALYLPVLMMTVMMMGVMGFVRVAPGGGCRQETDGHEGAKQLRSSHASFGLDPNFGALHAMTDRVSCQGSIIPCSCCCPPEHAARDSYAYALQCVYEYGTRVHPL